jgi:hypothetical protein
MEMTMMLRAACLSLVVPLLLVGRGAGAAAPECLSAVDGMIVEYDVPVVPGTQWGSAAASPGSKGAATDPGEQKPKAAAPTQQRKARPAAGSPKSGSKAAGSQPSDRHPMTEQQRQRLTDVLRRARIAEARGEEAQCMELFHQAEKITKGG